MPTTTPTPVTGYQITGILTTLADTPALAGHIDYTVGIARFVSALSRLTSNGSAPVTGGLINRAAVEAADPSMYAAPYPGNIAGIDRARDTAKALLALLSGE